MLLNWSLNRKPRSVSKFGDFLAVRTSKLPWQFFLMEENEKVLSRIVCDSQEGNQGTNNLLNFIFFKLRYNPEQNKVQLRVNSRKMTIFLWRKVYKGHLYVHE